MDDRELIDDLLANGLVDDPWVDGRLRLRAAPDVLDRDTAAALGEAAAAAAMVLDAVVHAAVGDPTLLALLISDPHLRAAAMIDAPRWLAFARADVFSIDGGGPPQVCELNADTPTGVVECVELGRFAAARCGLPDPSAALAGRWQRMMRSAVGAAPHPVAGLVDPTELTEDLGHLRLIDRWLGAAGFTVVRGGPTNLHPCPDGRVGLFGTPIDLLIRHYKTDWWARPSAPWRDAPPGPPVLERELRLISAAQAAGTLAVVNPWGSAIGQSKRALAVPWERPDLLDPAIVSAAHRWIPETRWLESVSQGTLFGQQELWVMKCDTGCEGEDVILGSRVDAAAWRRAVELAAPGRWVVQRAFTAQRDADGTIANRGVYLIGGQPSGIYTRRSHGPTDRTALSVPTLVTP